MAEQMIIGKSTTWPLNRTATRDLDDDFARMVVNVDIVDLGLGFSRLILPILVPITHEPFTWEAAEKRADWEESHGCFVEFNNVKDLLSNLNS